eukprot:gene23133-27497_t
MSSLDSLRTLKTLQIDDKTYHYFSLPEAAKSLGDLDKLPMSLKVLLENLLHFTGVPAVVDLAAMRAAVAKAGGDPQRINPLSPVDLVIDHSVMVD